MDWHILGAGAMGCLWASYLWLNCDKGTNGNVTLLLRHDEELDRYNDVGGVKLTTGAQSYCHNIPAYNLNRLFPPVTHLLVATKAQDVANALASIQHLLTPTTRIVLLQNGLKVQKEVAATRNPEHLYFVSTSQGAYLKQPFHVVHAGHGNTWLGQMGTEQHPLLLRALPVAKLHIKWDSDIETRMWEKFAINCAINALTVIYDCRNGELLTTPAARQDLLALTHEIEMLYRSLEDAPTLPDLQKRVHEVLQDTSHNFSSTLQDARQGRITEIAHLNGYLCELAQRQQFPCPVNKAILERFSFAVRARRPD